jgi:hypothetical protein
MDRAQAFERIGDVGARLACAIVACVFIRPSPLARSDTGIAASSDRPATRHAPRGSDAARRRPVPAPRR